jgi:hypothetical protein
MTIRPRLKGIVEGLVVAVIVGAVSSAFAWYQGVLAADAHNKVHLGPIGSAIVAVPPWVVVASAAFLAFLAALGASPFIIG